MASSDVSKLHAYATAAAGSVLCFLTLGSAVTFLDVATVSYFDLPRWIAAAVLAATIAPVVWFAIVLFRNARRFELSTAAAEVDTLGTDPTSPPQL